MSPTEGTPLLDYALARITISEAEQELAQNWGWILMAGVISVIAGFVSLASPVMASEVVLIVITCSLLVVGVIHITGMCFAENGLKGPSLVLGIAQVILAIVMQHNKLESLMTLTIIIAVMFIFDGVYRMAFAYKNRDMPGWKTCMVQGVCAVALSAVVLGAFPGSSLYTIGVLVGVNMVAVGIGRIAMAVLGRSLANSRITGNAGQPLV